MVVPPPAVLSYSLLDDLTRACNGAAPHGATDLITSLIGLTGLHVTAFKRNTQVSYRLVSRARDIRDKINKGFDDVDGSTGSDLNWDIFFGYVNAIDPLEQILYDLTNISSAEASLLLPENGSLSECLASVENWVHHRNNLRRIFVSLNTHAALKDLPGIPVISEEERINAERHDDIAFLSTLLSSFSKCASGAQGIHRTIKGQIVKVKDQLTPLLTKLKTAAYRDELHEFSGRTFIVLHGILKFILDGSSDVKTKIHLLKPEIWVAAETLIKDIVAVVDSTSSDLKDVQDKYQAFVDLLKNVAGVVLPPRYYDLPKQMGQVRRPYFARSHAFICACRVLATAFNDNAEKVHENVHSLEEAINETIAALQAAAKVMTTIETFDVAAIDTNDAGKAFVAAETKIAECFTLCGLNQAWTSEKTKMDAAAKQDAERVKQMNELLIVTPVKPSINGAATSTPVEVTVTTCIHSGGAGNDGKPCSHSGSSGKICRKSTYTVDSATPVSALLWKQANDFPDDRKHLDEGQAYFEQKKVTLSSDTAISALKEKTKGVYELNLVLE